MIVISVTYPASQGSRFDLDYYRRSHIPLVQSRWGGMGLKGARFLRGVGAPGGGPASYHLVALLSWESAEHFQRGVEQHGKEILGDVPKFTDITPVIQLNEEFE